MNGKFELNIKDLEKASGGTFFPNTYSKDGYHTFGICTSYHFFDKDEFTFMGNKYSADDADQIMKIGNDVMCALNSGTKGNDRIKADEPAFIRAFNSQLALSGYPAWDGKSGYDN